MIAGHHTPRYVTIPEAQRRTGLVRPIRRAIVRGEIPIIRPDGGWPRMRWADLERWLASQTVTPTRHAEARLAEVLEREGRAGV